jgi:long-chain acyl-CoA synthetase
MAAWTREARATLSPAPEQIVITLDSAGTSPIEGGITFAQLMAQGANAAPETHATTADDTAVMLYTSGTTGQPKGAELTHLNMSLNAMTSRDILSPALDRGIDARNVVLITLPLFHSTGQSSQMNTVVTGGWTMVLQPRFDPAAVLAAFEQEHISCWVGVPTMYWMLLQHAKARGGDMRAVAKSLRCVVSGGAPMPLPVLREFEDTFGVPVLEGYGLSETSPVACFNQLHRPAKHGTVGLPIAGTEIRIVDEDDQPRPTGERGEVVIRGPQVMKGYYKRPKETADALRGGWFHTGDIGVLDADGYLSIVDRKKDLILRGGMNVYPREIEDVLMTHPAISLAAVIGVPDERLGDEIKALVVLKKGVAATPDEIIAWSKTQMAAFKYPRTVEIRESLPLSGTGKILKRALRG